MQAPPRMEPRQRFASLPCQFSPTDRHRKGACQRFSVAAPSSAAGYSTVPVEYVCKLQGCGQASDYHKETHIFALIFLLAAFRSGSASHFWSLIGCVFATSAWYLTGVHVVGLWKACFEDCSAPNGCENGRRRAGPRNIEQG